MENKEIMLNDEVIENAAEVMVEEPKKGFGALVGIGLMIVAGVVIYKIGKKVVAKVKKTKEEKAAAIEGNFEVIEDDCDSTEEV